MRRVDLDHADDWQDNLLFHLARYKFVSRLISKNDRVLEIGCGTGYGARFISDHAASVIASDLDKRSLKYAKRRFHNRNLKFVDDFKPFGKFNAVVCIEVIEHVTARDGIELLKTIHSTLLPSGVAFISTPRKTPNPTENRKKNHLHEYTYDELKKKLEAVFSRVFIFSQNDEMISTQHPRCAWNYMAICCK